MTIGDTVVWLPEPFAMGLGTLTGVNEIGWLEVHWANGELGAYPAQHLELMGVWERQQVEQALAA